jgi:hypothetical protein
VRGIDVQQVWQFSLLGQPGQSVDLETVEDWWAG